MAAKTPTVRMTNGIEVERLFETIDNLAANPDLASFRFRAKNRWINASHNQTTVDGFYGAGEEHTHQKPFRFDEDEPPVLLGKDAGANPVEYLLTGLAGCLMTALTTHAAAKGIELTGVEAELEGDIDLRGFLGIDENVRNGYQDIRVKFHVESDAPREQLEELVQMAQARSPVFDVVTHGTRVHVSLAEEGGAEEDEPVGIPSPS